MPGSEPVLSSEESAIATPKIKKKKKKNPKKNKHQNTRNKNRAKILFQFLWGSSLQLFSYKDKQYKRETDLRIESNKK